MYEQQIYQRKVDTLGRVVLPQELRFKLKIGDDELLSITLDESGTKIILAKSST